MTSMQWFYHALCSCPICYLQLIKLKKHMHSSHSESDPIHRRLSRTDNVSTSNYNPGDEIFLFGFSRGAYTARMVAMLIVSFLNCFRTVTSQAATNTNLLQGEFGVLDRKDMDHFAKIFICYQKVGKADKEEGKQYVLLSLLPFADVA